MNLTTWLFLYSVAAVGHTATWIALFNQLHATNFKNKMLRGVSYPVFAVGILCLPLVLFYSQYTSRQLPGFTPAGFWELPGVLGKYVYFSLVMAVGAASVWTCRKVEQARDRQSLLSHRSRKLDFSTTAGVSQRSAVEKFFASVPGNQVYQCVIETREIYLPNISDCFDGLSITHLSDFHFTGKIRKEFFASVVKSAKELQSDMTVITGDFIDSETCWPWLQEILGNIDSPLGVYYVLGNHDDRVYSEKRLRQALDELGFVGVADRWVEQKKGDQKIHIAGNELPWFGSTMATSKQPDSFSRGDLRLLLTHSPDQWRWGRKVGFDLTLAGHTHGGQIQIPIIGPLISPSKHGVKYASGMFEQDEKVLIVSRGISSEAPVRFNCPPEVGQIHIRAKN